MVSFSLEKARADSSDAAVAAPTAPPRHTTWIGTSWLMLTDIVGTSVLTFAGVAAELGWVFTIALIVLMCPVAVYTGLLMSRTRQLLSKTRGIEPSSMGECARHTLGGDRAAQIVYLIVYVISGFLGNASYLLTLGQSFRGAFFDWKGLCDWTSVLISCLCVLPIVICVRRLSDSIVLCFINLFLIMAVLGIVIVKLISDGRGPEVETFMFAEGLSVLTVFTAMTNILFAYTGHIFYFEFMVEMKEPDHFPRVFFINAPLQMVMYLTVAVIGYYYSGSEAEGFFLDNLPDGPAYRWASGLLFVHVVIAFLIKNTILARFLHGMVSPARVEEASWRARGEYVACGISLLVLGFFVSNAIPFFEDFLGLVGGFFAGPTCFFLPMAFFVGARRIFLTQDASLLTLEEGNRTASAKDYKKGPLIPPADMVVMAFIAALTALTMVVGTYGNVKNIIAHAAHYGAPFTCHPTR